MCTSVYVHIYCVHVYVYIVYCVHVYCVHVYVYMYIMYMYIVYMYIVHIDVSAFNSLSHPKLKVAMLYFHKVETCRLMLPNLWSQDAYG